MADSKEMAVTAQQFLSRTQLSGQEVPAYIAVMDWLQGVATAPESGTPVQELEDA